MSRRLRRAATLVDDLNELLRNRPPRPQVLIVALEASGALRGVMEQEGRLEEGLLVGVDEQGGFCMEFTATPESDHLVFFHPSAPDVRLFASAITLDRIGGSTIDFREGRFKLDLPADLVAPACTCGGGKCTCADRK